MFSFCVVKTLGSKTYDIIRWTLVIVWKPILWGCWKRCMIWDRFRFNMDFLWLSSKYVYPLHMTSLNGSSLCHMFSLHNYLLPPQKLFSTQVSFSNYLVTLFQQGLIFLIIFSKLVFDTSSLSVNVGSLLTNGEYKLTDFPRAKNTISGSTLKRQHPVKVLIWNETVSISFFFSL